MWQAGVTGEPANSYKLKLTFTMNKQLKEETERQRTLDERIAGAIFLLIYIAIITLLI